MPQSKYIKYIPRNEEVSFIAAKLVRIGLVYLANLIIQIYLVSKYPAHFNSSYQITLKWISIIQLVFVSGYGYLALNYSTRPIDLRAIWKNYKLYQLFNVSWCVIAVIALFTLYYLSILNLNSVHFATTVLLLALFSGSSLEVSAFRYAQGDHLRYEYGGLAASCISVLFICVLLFSSNKFGNARDFSSLYLPIATILPLTVYNFSFILFSGCSDSRATLKLSFSNTLDIVERAFANLKLSKIIQSLRDIRNGDKPILLKAKSFQALQLVAALNWGTDLLIIGVMGTPTEVNHASLTLTLFSISSTIVSIYSQRLQILYSESAIKRVRFSWLGPRISHCFFSTLPSIVILFLLLLLKLQFPITFQPFGSYSLIVAIALSVFLSNIGSFQGIYLNSANLPGRQVIKDLFIVIPLNIGLSIVFISFLQATGVFVATIIALLVSIFINTHSIRSHCNAK